MFVVLFQKNEADYVQMSPVRSFLFSLMSALGILWVMFPLELTNFDEDLNEITRDFI